MEVSPPLSPPPAAPEPIHNCPECSHWLPEGTLACPDCHTLTYSHHLSVLAAGAQMLEQQQKWPEARDRWRDALQWLPEDTRQSIGIQQHIAAIDQRLQNEEDRKARWTKRLGPLAPIALFLLKAKSALFFLLKAKFLFSFLAFFGVYWALLGWKFALGFTLGILVHELGHYITAHSRGMKAELPIFLPGFGAYVRWFSQGAKLSDLSAIALAGPTYGLGVSAICWLIALHYHSTLFLVLANTTAWINLANLIAVFGLDGSTACYALNRMQRFMVAATCVIFYALVCSHNWTNVSDPNNHIILVVIAGTLLWRCFTNDAPQEPHTATLTTYVGLIIILGIVVHMTGAQLLQIPEIADKYLVH